MATIETLEAEIDRLKADVRTTISRVEAEATPKATEAAVAKSREGEVKPTSPTEEANEVKTAITKADEPVATAKPKEAEAKVVAPAENKNEITTIRADGPAATAKPREAEVKAVAPAENKGEIRTIRADGPAATAKPKEGEIRAISPTQNKAKDAVEKVKTRAVYIGKGKFWVAVCLAFLFGVAVGSFICTYATRSSLGRTAASVGVNSSSAGRP
jgi:sulfite reductase alpha subunit-like flavoprotein